MGRHLVKDRAFSGVFLSPSEQEGVPSYLFASGPVYRPDLPAPLDKRTLVDVYAFTDGAPAVTAEGLAGHGPVIEGMDIPGQDPTNHILATDSLGRPLFIRWNRDRAPAIQDSFELWRLHPTSGVQAALAYASLMQGGSVDAATGREAPPFIQSPGRSQLFTGYSGLGWLIGLERQQFIWQANDPTFIGEDFYCSGIVTPDPNGSPSSSSILRIKPDTAPEVLPFSSTGFLGIAPVASELAPQLLVSLYTDLGLLPIAMFDTLTFESRSLPDAKGQSRFVSASSDGRLLLLRTAVAPSTETEPGGYQLFVYDWVSDRYATITSAWTGKRISGTAEWRPGTNELWFDTYPDGFAIWKPGDELVLVDATLYRFQPAVSQPSVFSRDGRHWFANEPGLRLTVSVGSASNPHAPRVPLHPPGTQANGYWEIADGRLLVQAWASDYWRNDIYLVDAEAGTSRAIGSAGRLVAAGRERALALLHWQVSRSTGELTLLDYASGAHTLLASDVYAVAVDRGSSATVPPGTDALAPGTRVAFLSRNRLESRDDGLWAAELP